MRDLPTLSDFLDEYEAGASGCGSVTSGRNGPREGEVKRGSRCRCFMVVSYSWNRMQRQVNIVNIISKGLCRVYMSLSPGGTSNNLCFFSPTRPMLWMAPAKRCCIGPPRREPWRPSNIPWNKAGRCCG